MRAAGSFGKSYVNALVPRLGVGLDARIPTFEATLRHITSFAHLGPPNTWRASWTKQLL